MEDTLKLYLTALLAKGKREDGRMPFDYRDIQIEVNPLSRACGSARVKIGETEVLVGVKMDVGEPFPDGPEEGILIVNAELVPLASPDFESGPPSPSAIELARVVDRGIREAEAVDFSKLCIVPKEKVWTVFVDIFPLNDDGNLFDAAALGAIIALKNAYLPKYDKEAGVVLYKEFTKEKLPVDVEPILTTFAKLSGNLFLDMTRREEKAFDTRLSVATIENGNITAMQKGGPGTLTEKEVLEIIGYAGEKSRELRKFLK